MRVVIPTGTPAKMALNQRPTGTKIKIIPNVGIANRITEKITKNRPIHAIAHLRYFKLDLRSVLLDLVRFRVSNRPDYPAILFIGDDFYATAFINEVSLSNYVYTVIVNVCDSSGP